MAYGRQMATKQRSHESYMFQNISELDNLETGGANSNLRSRTLSPISRCCRSATLPPMLSSASMGSNSGEPFVMTYAVSSPISSPVPFNFGVKNFSSVGNTLPAPVILSAPVSPILDSPTRRKNSVPVFGTNMRYSEGNPILSQEPCIPKPVKVCRQVSVPQSLHPQRATTLRGISSGVKGIYSSSFRRLSHCRIGSIGSSTVAIDNKIEQAMDLVKSHLMFAVREEVEVLKEQIAELIERNNQLEYENNILRAAASPETLAKLAQPRQQPPPPSS